MTHIVSLGFSGGCFTHAYEDQMYLQQNLRCLQSDRRASTPEFGLFFRELYSDKPAVMREVPIELVEAAIESSYRLVEGEVGGVRDFSHLSWENKHEHCSEIIVTSWLPRSLHSSLIL